MQRHFVQELEALKSNIIRMGSLVEAALDDALKALLERNADLTSTVFAGEHDINRAEIQNDDAIVDLLALQQPVASDLRFILAAMKINNDLERIGDHAVNIAESAQSCARRPESPMSPHIPRMAQVARSMLKQALDGFVNADPAESRKVLEEDDLIDNLNRQISQELVAVIRSDATTVEQSLDILRVSRNLERIADLATNIAEEVIFVAEAQVVKHRQDLKASS